MVIIVFFVFLVNHYSLVLTTFWSQIHCTFIVFGLVTLSISSWFFPLQSLQSHGMFCSLLNKENTYMNKKCTHLRVFFFSLPESIPVLCMINRAFIVPRKYVMEMLTFFPISIYVTVNLRWIKVGYLIISWNI